MPLSARTPARLTKILRACLLILCATSWPTSAPAQTTTEGLIRFDFETGDLQGWRVVQGQFGPLVSRRDVAFRNGQPFKKQGHYFLCCFEGQPGQWEVASTGLIESPVFVLNAPEISLMVGGGPFGGPHETTYIALCALDGREVQKAMANTTESLRRIAWSVPELVGQPLFLRLSDGSAMHHGQISLDDVQARGRIDPVASAERFDRRAREFRRAGLQERLNPAKITSLRAAVQDLAASFPETYKRGGEFHGRLSECEKEFAALPASQTDDQTLNALAALATRFEALQREALLANPLVSGQPLVYVTRPQYAPDHHNTETVFQTDEINTSSFAGGGALKVLDLASSRTRTLVDAPQGIARDPELHFDGKKIVFSMRRNIQEDYKIYEIGADGSGLRQLTYTPGVADIDPLYMPDDSIVFSSTRDPKYCMCNAHIMANLYRMDGDGANILLIGKNTLWEGHGALLEDGRILYDRWEYVDRNFGDAQGLWTVNPDGTNHAIYWGNNTPSPGGVIDARPIPGRSGQVIAILGSCHDRPWGALGIIDRALGLDGRKPIVRTWPAEAHKLVSLQTEGHCDAFMAVRPRYEDPYPLSDKYFLCSRSTGVGEQMGLCLIDVFGNELMLHVEGPGCYDPMPIKARPRPPIIPARRNYKDEDGAFYVADVYQGTHMRGVKRGSVKWLRVVESPEKRFWTGPAWEGQGVHRPAMNWHDFSSKRILGTVPVAADGSAYFKAPMHRFLFFQLLDENGMMIQSMRSGTMIQPGEVTGCTGCHEHRLSAPPSTMAQPPQALRKAPTPLKGWRGHQRPFNYVRDVQPVFDKNCISCHDFGKPGAGKLLLAGDRDLVFNASYNELWRKGYTGGVGAGPAKIQQAYSWGAHASKLIKVLQAGHHGVKLDSGSMDRLVTWLDMNAPYYPEYSSAYPDNLAGRAPITVPQMNRLAELTGVPFHKLAGHYSNQGPQVSFARPELSPCLAGLKERNSAGYDEALAIIRAGAAMLKQRPDAEMDGYVPCELDLRRQRKSDALIQFDRKVREALAKGGKVYEPRPSVADAKAEVKP